MDSKNNLGLVHIYTGCGKGKTTSALGLMLRAVGQNKSCGMIQFLKGAKKYGEHKAVTYLKGAKIVQTGRSCLKKKDEPTKIDCEDCFKKFSSLPCHIVPSKIQKKDKAEAEKAIRMAQEILQNKKYDILILDEVGIALKYKLIKLKDVISLIKNKPKDIELILTGRYIPKKLFSFADYVSEIKEIKHPYQKGICAREGIEY